MTAFHAAVILFASLLPQEAPRIDEQPKRVCLDAPRAIFQVENGAAAPILAVLSVEHWSDEGDTAGWVIVQEDITQRQARPKQVRNLKLDARQRRNVAWEQEADRSPAAGHGTPPPGGDLVQRERRDSRHGHARVRPDGLRRLSDGRWPRCWG